MYAVVCTQRSAADEQISEEASRLAAELLTEAAAESSGQDDADVSTIEFSAGNPRVEHITGVVHLYRHVPSRDEAEAQGTVLLPEDRGERLCVLSLPLDMGVADFCAFVGGYLPKVREMRLVRREGGRTTCLVLVRFDSLATADDFFRDFNARPFSSLEPDVVCRLVYVKDIQITSTEEGESPKPPAGQTELPTCPVCLERLDAHISGVVTTVCNHKFHNECLQRWGDTSCPVCRYCASATSTTSHCSTCGTSQDLWICLICGHIGCGRYREGHAVDHWREHSHCYALELETQRVWDYVSDGYVHRLIQSKTDGKLVEVPSPAPAPAEGRAGRSCSGTGEGLADSYHDQYGEDLQTAMMKSVRESAAVEFDHLLVTQLESQRMYFEGLINKARLEAESRVAEAQGAADKSEAVAHAARAEAHEADCVRRGAERKCIDLTGKITKLAQERDELLALNKSLRDNQSDLKVRLESVTSQAGLAAAESARRIQDLEEQLRDLMFTLEAQASIQGNHELRNATVLPMPVPAEQPQTKRRTARRQR
ncbi:hypothetical protein WJX72_001734 [[Myrmecia] bisecta]|uniref:BRCA1-associated protein n=1 Tax=[Myrmecia] bisecta TaxID=41462 RepID=A0AAW1PGZ5_9CHLO